MIPTGQIQSRSTYVLGVDMARMGEDSTVFVVIEQPHDTTTLYVVYIEEVKKSELTDSCGRVMWLHDKFSFSKIYIDCTGLGEGPVDFLKQANRIGGGVVEGIRFMSEGDLKKVDIYSNLNILLKSGRLKIPNHSKLKFELLDLRYTISDNGKLKIHHAESSKAHDDFPDALALAALYWKGSKNKQGYGWHVA